MLCIYIYISYICIYLHIWYLYIHTINIKKVVRLSMIANVYWISFEGLLSVFHLKECHPCQEKAAPKAAKATAEAKPKAAAADKKSATTAATPRAEAKVKAWRYHKPFGRNWGKTWCFCFKNWILHEFESRHRQRRPSNFQLLQISTSPTVRLRPPSHRLKDLRLQWAPTRLAEQNRQL